MLTCPDFLINKNWKPPAVLASMDGAGNAGPQKDRPGWGR